MKNTAFIIIFFGMTFFCVPVVHAEYAPAATQKKELSLADRMSLARQFVAKISKGFAEADKQNQSPEDSLQEELRRLDDGEELLFRVRLGKKLYLDSPILSRTQNGKLLVSLRDFVLGLELPIAVTPEEGIAQGWYIRETKRFDLDAKTREVKTENGVFKMSADVMADENDIFVPSDELAQWFGFTLEPDIGALEYFFRSPTPLPIMERLERGKRTFANYRIGPPELPRLEGDEQKVIDLPFVDVSSRTSYQKKGNAEEGVLSARSSVRTTGDFLFGTLDTQSQFEKEEKLTNVRATYRKESLEGDLLGPLNARKVEVGDVNSYYFPVKSASKLGLGARITNRDPLRGTLLPSTEIRGSTFPGWEVELYRDNQLISYKTVAEDGQYVFDNVDLYGTDNNFKVVLYGPQGEIREEEISVPVDFSRLSEGGGAYDISVLAQDTQAYRKQDFEDEDNGAPFVSATYEVPIGNHTAVSAGFDTAQEEGERTATAYTGLSTSLLGALVNLNTAVEQDGEMGAEIVARRDIEGHQIRNEISLATPGFNAVDSSLTETDPFKEEFSVNGPLPLGIGQSPRYNLGLAYAMEADGDNRIDFTTGLSTTFDSIGFGQQFDYSMYGDGSDDRINSLTSVTGHLGQNNLRFLADYNIMPDSQLERVSANVRRRITPKADVDFNLEHQLDPQLTEGRAQVNWKTGFGTVSPSLSYNTDRDMTALLSTRFGAAHEPFTKGARLFDQGITSNGGVSALVFLDKDGDNIYDGEDELLPDVIVQSPQNTQRVKTDEKGVAFFHRLPKLKPTDIAVDDQSLPDPFWISGFEGASIIPREGHVSTLTFPIHISGEIDGTVYARGDNGTSQPLRGVPMSLYTPEGKKIMTAYSESDGFYLLSKVPPGDYYLNIDADKVDEDVGRPMPQSIHIGYEGTTVYGNNIYMEPGKSDIPIKFLADTTGIKDDPKALEGQTVFLNLGVYKSRLMMGLAWFKMRSMHGGILNDVDLIEKPSESYPDIKTGVYTLRAIVRSNNFDSAYAKCRAISGSKQPCSVEVLPGGYKSKLALQTAQPNS